MAIFRRYRSNLGGFARKTLGAASTYAAGQIGRSAVRYGSKLVRSAAKKIGRSLPVSVTKFATNESPVTTYRSSGRRLSKGHAACIGYKLQFRSACLDVNFTNTGSGGVILDVYTLLCRKSYVTASTNTDVQFTSQFAEQAGTLVAVNVAVTPFQNPGFLQYWKIIGHKSVHLKTGEICSMQVRQNRRKWLDGKVLTQNVNGIPGWTKVVFFQMRGEVENNAGTARYAGGTLSWKARKTYTYQFPADRNRVTQVDA